MDSLRKSLCGLPHRGSFQTFKIASKSRFAFFGEKVRPAARKTARNSL